MFGNLFSGKAISIILFYFFILIVIQVQLSPPPLSPLPPHPPSGLRIQKTKQNKTKNSFDPERAPNLVG